MANQVKFASARTYTVPHDRFNVLSGFVSNLPASVGVEIMFRLRGELHDALIEGQTAIAEDALKRMKDKIRNGTAGFTALSAEWRERKARRGGDPRTLIDTGGYLESLTVTMIDGVAFVGASPGSTDKDGTSYGLIGMAHELGRGPNPPRPHMAPVVNEIAQKARLFIKKEVAKMVVRLRP